MTAFPHRPCFLLHFYALSAETLRPKVVLDLVPVVSLKQDDPLLGGPPTRELPLHAAGQLGEVDVLGVHPLKYGGGFPETSHFESNYDSRLLLFEFFANAEVLREAANLTNFGH